MPEISPAPAGGTHDGKTTPCLLVNATGHTQTPVYRTNVLYRVPKKHQLLAELWRQIVRTFGKNVPQWRVMRSRRAKRNH